MHKTEKPILLMQTPNFIRVTLQTSGFGGCADQHQATCAHHEDEKVEDATAIEKRDAKGGEDADAAATIAVAIASKRAHKRWC